MMGFATLGTLAEPFVFTSRTIGKSGTFGVLFFGFGWSLPVSLTYI
jgi:hypothetical protein